MSVILLRKLNLKGLKNYSSHFFVLRIIFSTHLLGPLGNHLPVKCYILFFGMCNGVIERVLRSKIK